MSDQPLLHPVSSPIKPTPDEALAGIMDHVKLSIYSSFDLDNHPARSSILAAIMGESIDLKSVINTRLEIVGFVVRASEPRIAADGEIVVYPVAYLISSDGTVVRAGSKGVLQSLRLFETEQPGKLWTPPIVCFPRSRNIGDGKNWIYLSRKPE